LPEKPFALGIPAVLALSTLISLLRGGVRPGAYRDRRSGERDRPCRVAFVIGLVAADIIVLSLLLFAAGIAALVALTVFHGLRNAELIS